MSDQIIVFAPNVHAGGGLVLLQELLNAYKPDMLFCGFLDARAFDRLEIPKNSDISWVSPTLLGRFLAEFSLVRKANISGAPVLCFHSLPPLFPFLKKVTIFVQNRLLLIQDRDVTASAWVRLRVGIERLWLSKFSKKDYFYIVQTQSMKDLLELTIPKNSRVLVKAFASLQCESKTTAQLHHAIKFDFIYVASGEKHKNHTRLLQAWQILAQLDIKPTLALTLDRLQYQKLTNEIDDIGLSNVVNLGSLDFLEVQSLYTSCSAMIFPSLVESFGLPLIEAQQHHLPVIASELDYVRDVASPVESFDPNSAISIARAVQRYLKKSMQKTRIYTASDFISEVTKCEY